MAKNIPSPYLSAPPLDRLVRSAGDQPNHYMYSLEDELILYPLELLTSGGALVGYKAPDRISFEDRGGGNIRLWHPYFELQAKHLYLTAGTDQALTVVSTNNTSGYTDLAVPVGDHTWQGYLAARGTKEVNDAEVYQTTDKVRDTNLIRSLAEREREGVQSPVPGLCVSWLTFRVNASGDPIGSTANGSLAFNVNHTGAGTYEVTFTTEWNSGTIAAVTANGVSGTAAVDGSDLNKIDLTLAADPADQDRISLLVMHPTTIEGRSQIIATTPPPPRLMAARDGVFCSCALMRDLCFIPVSFSLTGGNIAVDEIDTVIPANVAISKQGNDYRIEFGRTHASLIGASFINRTEAAPPLPITYDPQVTGSIVVTTASTDAVITGWICAATNSER